MIKNKYSKIFWSLFCGHLPIRLHPLYKVIFIFLAYPYAIYLYERKHIDMHSHT